jgi:hypothetical protein
LPYYTLLTYTYLWLQYNPTHTLTTCITECEKLYVKNSFIDIYCHAVTKVFFILFVLIEDFFLQWYTMPSDILAKDNLVISALRATQNHIVLHIAYCILPICIGYSYLLCSLQKILWAKSSRQPYPSFSFSYHLSASHLSSSSPVQQIQIWIQFSFNKVLPSCYATLGFHFQSNTSYLKFKCFLSAKGVPIPNRKDFV